ncbi:hypothetical protein [[Clostridium] fimetarium]|uniref:XRE family transcriptional regulator n=1 Tax=[Clostridium] fimetarium TaxID=99656 RepID=A0A1I0M0G6_9FIRM|nr:hypothetical protein [[Clostridium] fimetarium]SEV81568.1 hypothetical protein SAMN05421659_10125 [[Clostridium] fimetarium]
MVNQEIRRMAKEKGVKLWCIAEKLNLSDGNFSRLLRHNLPDEKAKKIIKIIEELASNSIHE